MTIDMKLGRLRQITSVAIAKAVMKVPAEDAIALLEASLEVQRSRHREEKKLKKAKKSAGASSASPRR